MTSITSTIMGTIDGEMLSDWLATICQQVGGGIPELSATAATKATSVTASSSPTQVIMVTKPDQWSPPHRRQQSAKSTPREYTTASCLTRATASTWPMARFTTI